MPLSKWLLKKRNFQTQASFYNISEREKENLWIKCNECELLIYHRSLTQNFKVCSGCSYHFSASSQERIDQMLDPGTWKAADRDLVSTDPLGFADQKLYKERLKNTRQRTGLKDAVQTGTGQIGGITIGVGIMDFKFMGGSMGSVVGEKLTRLIETATKAKIPVIIVCASGGARMQEGLLSLMQMAKISSALQQHKSANLLYIPVLTSPTTGGVTASFAMLGDLIIAEPNALIAFAGRRVIEQTIREDLPNNFQTSEYLFQHGFIDLIVPRTKLKKTLEQLLLLHQK